jgi:predicted DNA-binding transcriptional regulator AlpA
MPNANMHSLAAAAPAMVRMTEDSGREMMNAIGAASDRGIKSGPAYPPRGMRVEQAADYLSMSKSMWLKLVDEGKMPKPIKIGAMTTRDRHDIDDAFEDLKRGDKNEPSENTVHKRLRELANGRSP